MVEQWSVVLCVFAGVALLAALGGFGVISIREGEPRAARIAFAAAAGVSSVFFVAAGLPEAARAWFLILMGILLVAAVLLFFLPIGRTRVGPGTRTSRFDERDVMFARARLRPGSAEHEAYYAMRPDKRAGDDLSRSKPGLLSPLARHADPWLFSSAEAGFMLTEALRGAVDGPVSETRRELPPARMTAYLKALARYYGALDAGVTELRAGHVYSHIGRGTGTWGAPLAVEHRYAIAFTVEMDHRMIASNPKAPGVAESARQYVESARVAVQLANALRLLGYPARAHIDGNYRVIAPLVARDAGLGEIGRMGLLMTPRLGPRVRLGVVTTGAELIPDRRGADASVIDFCSVCRKCSDNCPAGAIPAGAREEEDGALRWRVNPDTCYRYWCVVGTDCGLCMTVCPYSHPDSVSHNLVRWGVRRSGIARRIAYRLDDLFYGKKPGPRPPPGWTAVE